MVLVIDYAGGAIGVTGFFKIIFPFCKKLKKYKMQRGLKKGMTNNRNGRPTGSKNKVNNELRDKVSAFLDGEFESVKRDFKKLSPRDRLKFYTDLLQYGLPKLQAASLEINFDDMSDDQLDLIISRIVNK